MPQNSIKIRRALISVSDKTGIVDFARTLHAQGIEILSTGGSAKTLRDAGIATIDVAEITQYPEMMDGRVKTLHPAIHAGLLALRDNVDHLTALETYNIHPIDLLVVNLYPFESTVASGGNYTDCIENIDIGGPAMIRAAAKNHAFVGTVVDIEDYDRVLAHLKQNNGAMALEIRKDLAQIAYAYTASYDAAVSTWMAKSISNPMPRRRVIASKLEQKMRYGENPHQAAYFYKNTHTRTSIANAIQHQGKALSYNNINDTDAALELISEFPPNKGPAVAIIKHANPCGVSRARTLKEAYQQAYHCDQTSAFGGIIALNSTLDGDTAREITKIFTEVVIAPDITDEARAVFALKKNLRLLTTGCLLDVTREEQTWRQVSGGYLIQDRDNGVLSQKNLHVVTQREPSEKEIHDMLFAWHVVKHVKSNAIVYAKNQTTIGIGAGQMSRVDSTRIATQKTNDMTQMLGHSVPLSHGSVIASDAFFPFADGLLAAAKAGATAVIQPGGSLRDQDIINAANKANLAMIFTGMRHFKH